MYDSRMHYDSVFVVQSLKPNEDPTGSKLFEGTIAPAVKRDHLVAGLWDSIQTRQDLLAVLDQIAAEVEEHQGAPILHLEAHGGREGMELARPGEPLVPWSDLTPYLLRMTSASRMNALVVAGMCKGVNLVDVLDPRGRAPAFGVIGAEESMSPDDLLDAMRLFYGSLLNGDGADLSLRVMRSEGRGEFSLQTAEIWLCRVFRASLELDDETREERVSRLLHETLQGRIPDVTESMAKRVEIARALDDHRYWFQAYRRSFLWLDEFPENEARFQFSYEDCMAVAS